MQRARRHQQSKAFRRLKRRRQVVEHRIARLRQLGVRQTRYMGRAKTLFQLLMAATVANLTLVAGVVSAAGTLGCRFFLLIDRYLRGASRRSASPTHSGPWFTGRLHELAVASALLPSRSTSKKRGFRPRFSWSTFGLGVATAGRARQDGLCCPFRQLRQTRVGYASPCADRTSVEAHWASPGGPSAVRSRPLQAAGTATQ